MPPESESIAQFIAKHWVSILVAAIGVIGSVASIISWLSARRSRRVYDRLFQAAQLVLERESKSERFETEIAEKKKQASEYEAAVRRYSDKIVALQEQIQRDIPKAARKAALKDRLDSAVALMKAHYDEVVTITEELERIGEDTEVSRELLRAVRAQIQPRHVLRERMSHLRTLLTIVTTSAAAASTLLPWPLSKYVGFVLLLVAVPVIVLLLRDVMIARGLDHGRKSRLSITGLRREDGIAQQDAAPNGGPATQLGNSGATEGPPSVS